MGYNVSDDNGLQNLDGEADLDAILAESIQLQEDTKYLQRDKQRLAQQARKEEAKKKIISATNFPTKSYATTREWVPVAAVALFHTQRCIACGTNHTHFMGVFQRQQKTNDGISGTIKSEQWVRAIDHTMIDGLPKEQKETDEPVDMCICCSTQLGYPPKLYA